MCDKLDEIQKSFMEWTSTVQQMHSYDRWTVKFFDELTRRVNEYIEKRRRVLIKIEVSNRALYGPTT
ncbi:hypothetical protein CaLGV023 [Clostera anastomosis granulovirus A]|uniref:Uncharacterized protein n=1 Tax=Clostera anastomosis granulovirus A TaxID=1986289 RepID=U5KAS0_9BBAC|nr:hypothetical protein CaLGV023 [Clostera anastomosis granulovirus Henan]AGQ20282.1 hypothetical protein CaLGV023 [Clostera anastomosis granulovirus Henan]